MIRAKPNICLICLAGIVVAGAGPNGIEAGAVWQNSGDYAFMWWAYGLRDPSRVFHIQTSQYGLSFDFDDFELKTFGPIVNAPSEEEALFQDNSLVESLDRAALRCVVEYDGHRYEAHTVNTLRSRGRAHSHAEIIDRAFSDLRVVRRRIPRDPVSIDTVRLEIHAALRSPQTLRFIPAWNRQTPSTLCHG